MIQITINMKVSNVTVLTLLVVALYEGGQSIIEEALD